MAINGKATLLAVRAIGAAFGVKIWWTVFIISLIIAALVIGLCVWLISLSAWWWILGALFGIALSVSFAILAVFRMLLAYVSTAKTKEQKEGVKDFVQKLEFVKELTETPKFIILFRIVRSVAAPSSEKYLENIFESRKLKDDFEKVVGLF